MIGVRLKEERERLGLTQPAFAEAAGAAKRTLIEWEKGTTSPNSVQLSALAAIGVDVYYVLTGEPNLFITDEKVKQQIKRHESAAPAEEWNLIDEGQPGKLRPTSSSEVEEPRAHYVAPNGFILVPHYEVHASAGNGSLVHSEQIVDYLAFKADWVRNTLGVAQKDLALISVKGDSMEPELSNDDLILVDMRKNSVEDNAIYVLQFDGTLLVKRIQRKLDGSLHVMSDNPRYDAEVVSAERAADLRVLGRVVWSGRRM